MKLALYHLGKNNRRARAVTALPDGASWAQFGEDVLLYGDEAQAEQLAKIAGRGARQVRGPEVSLKREQLHVVVQNGRMFQQENPKTQVLLDRGRYLLVKMDPSRAQVLKDKSPTCYGVFPLLENQVVFDVRDAESSRASKVAWIQTLVGQLARTSLEANLTHLVGFETRFSTSTNFNKASTWARDQLKALSYTTRFQTITVNGSPSRNLIADKKGQGAGPKKVVLVTAHLDSINIPGGPTAPAPGADDNGSGSAGLLEIARVFAAHKGEQDLRFILFGGEEEGLFGSKQYVGSLSATEKSRIRSVVNMDMVATLNIPTQSVLLEGATLSQRVIDGLNTAAATYTHLKVETSLNPFASDHVPFIKANVPAVLTIEGADNTNSNIHSDRDTLNHINYDFALEILRMNVAFIAGEIGKATA
jgi:hypothetical protein